MLRFHFRRAFAVVGLVIAMLPVGAVHAQDGTPTLDQLQELQQLRSQKSANTQAPPAAPLVLKPMPRTPEVQGTSVLEQIMSMRAGQSLKQFGYDQVGASSEVAIPQTGAIQDNYVLGPGDELDVVLRGQENSSYTVVVDRNGQVVLPRLSPISAAGRSLGDFRSDLSAQVHRAYVSTDVFVSMDKLRQVSVLVTGEVGNPGRVILTGLSTPLDAVELAGGIKKSGSLRSIRLVRDGNETTVDLYGLLTREGHTELPNLQDGDRIFVPPVGKTVGVGGFVRRPAIYELPPGQSGTTARELFNLADGATYPGVYNYSISRTLPNGKIQFVDITGQLNTVLYGGDVMMVRSEVNASIGRIELVGAVRVPGAYAADKYHSVHDLLPSTDVMLPGAYMLFGFIDRIDPTTLARTAVPFSPLHVIQGKENVTLHSGDTVHILSGAGVEWLLGGLPQQKERQESPQPSRGANPGPAGPGPVGVVPSGIQAELAARGMGAPENSAAIASGGATASGIGEARQNAPGVNARTATAETDAAAATESDLGGFSRSEGAYFGKTLSEYQFTVAGAVHHPGTFLAAPGTTLAEALIAVGGLTDDVDLSRFELTSTSINNLTGTSETNRGDFAASPEQFARIVLKPFDSLLFRHVYSDKAGGSVTLSGEVRYPGTYGILRGERLSSVLMRAGGLTDVAYPYGTVFLRRSVAEREAAGNRRAASDLRDELLEAMVRPMGANSVPLTADTIKTVEGLLSQLESQPALGRVSIVADPAVLASRPNRDPILEPGDSITIPNRPSTVTVLGQVMQPGSFPFDNSASASDYIARAGGLSQYADSGRIIVILPDGAARVAESSWLSFGGSGSIPPGSVIVVPRDLSSLSLHQLIVDTTQIVSQLATTAAALAVLSKY